MKSIRIFCLLLSIAAWVTACKGPEGPQGEIGPAGPQGAGSVKSQSFTVSNWVFTSPSWTGTISYAAITADIMSTGGVFVYWKNAAGNWTALPITNYATDWYSTTMQAEHYVGGVKIVKTDSDLTEPLAPGNQEFKVLVMEGQHLVRNADLDWSDYEAVNERLQCFE
jgi:hypothetical protein